MTNDESFVDFETGLDRVLEQSKYAYFVDKQTVLSAFPQYECKVFK